MSIFTSAVGLKLLIDPILSAAGSEPVELCPSHESVWVTHCTPKTNLWNISMTSLHHWFFANLPHGKIPSEFYPTFPPSELPIQTFDSLWKRAVQVVFT